MKRKRLALPPSRVALLLGRRGGGKSCAAAAFAWDWHQEDRPVFYWPEGFLKFGEPFDMDELVSLSERIAGGLIVIDEAHTALDNRRSMSIANQAISHFIVQLRKRKASMILTTQDGGMLDRRLQSQVDHHGWCQTKNEGRTIMIRWTDTQGQWSPLYLDGSGRKDGRRRRYQLIRRADRLWNKYDTDAVASLRDVLEINRDTLLGRQTQDPNTVLPIVRQAVIEAVSAGEEWIGPGNFVMTLSETYKLEISPNQLGRYLAELNLPRTHRKDGAFYQLPGPDDLEAWQSGAFVLSDGGDDENAIRGQ